MPEIKIILAEKPWNYRSKSAQLSFESTITDWEVVSDRDYKDLMENIKYLPEPPYNRIYQVLVKDPNPAKKYLRDLKPLIDKKKAEAAEQAEKKAERARKRAEAAKRKKEREEKAELERLKAKYGA